jgi:hypothetical protein
VILISSSKLCYIVNNILLCKRFTQEKKKNEKEKEKNKTKRGYKK